MRDPNNPQTWMDAMEQVRDQFEPALTVDALAPRIEALYADQGLVAYPGQAQAAAKVCLSRMPEESPVASKPMNQTAPRAGRLFVAAFVIAFLGSLALVGIPLRDHLRERQAQTERARQAAEEAKIQAIRAQAEEAYELSVEREKLRKAIEAADAPGSQGGTKITSSEWRDVGLRMSAAFVSGYGALPSRSTPFPSGAP